MTWNSMNVFKAAGETSVGSVFVPHSISMTSRNKCCITLRYVNGVHCKTSGPYQRNHLNSTDLTEMEIRQNCETSNPGFSVNMYCNIRRYIK